MATLEDLKEKVRSLRTEFQQALAQAQDLGLLEQIRVRFTGRKSELTQLLRSLKDLPPESRREAGELLNTLKEEFLSALQQKRQELEAKAVQRLDLTLPARPLTWGTLHLLTLTLKEILEIFAGMGFTIEEGPNIEWDHYNFEALNIPKYHPARETQSTFFITDEMLLRTHTSPVQVRVMERKSPPLRFVAPGRVFRVDPFDASHAPAFFQMEGLYVDRHVTFAELKGTLEAFLRQFFGGETKVRFVPSHFPFTEPSAEVLILWRGAQGREQWLEVLGCGMVHPNVFRAVGYDPQEWKGFAFGFGIERLAMVKYGVPDIRWFTENDLRFLKGARR